MEPGFWGKPWSDNPNAPRITRTVYLKEKTTLAGSIVGAVGYGIVISLFLKCMNALLDPVNRKKGGIKWWLVAHTTAMFSLVTIYTAIELEVQSVGFIDNREFSGYGVLPPGPFGYMLSIFGKAVPNVALVICPLNNWLTDGLVLYRCYVIYSKSRWAIAFPALLYLASFGTGIAYIYQNSRPIHDFSAYTAMTTLGIAYYSVIPSLNVLLTLMIITRLVLHSRSMRGIMGTSAGANGPYAAIIVMLIESCALYSGTFLLFVILWAARSYGAMVLLPALIQVQTIAPLLITLRVARLSTATSETSISETTDSIDFGGHGELVGSNGSIPDRYPMNSTNGRVKTSVELSVAVEPTTIDLRRDD